MTSLTVDSLANAAIVVVCLYGLAVMARRARAAGWFGVRFLVAVPAAAVAVLGYVGHGWALAAVGVGATVWALSPRFGAWAGPRLERDPAPVPDPVDYSTRTLPPSPPPPPPRSRRRPITDDLLNRR